MDSANRQRCRVLVVDDDHDTVETARILLEMSGHEVFVALDGATALQKAKEISPDVVLLDISMPKMDGYEVARRLRETAGKRIALVAVTGHGQSSWISRSREAGFDCHLIKPVELGEVDRFIALQATLRGTSSETADLITPIP